MKPVRAFRVEPALPERLRPLEELAYNLRWSWDHETINLFRRLDRELWEETYHNPVLMLGSLSQDRLQEAAEDEAFLAYMERVKRQFREYTERKTTWYHKTFGPHERPLVAYFSMEFGITECLPTYSGGLGILAGDHLKSASELGLPLVGVGILFQKGYFRQYLNPDGWQQEHYPINDFHTLPLRRAVDEQGRPRRVEVEIAGQPAQVQLWHAEIGRVGLIMLDTNLPENPAAIQDITDELYGGDLEMRMRQEIVLGIGGVRALEALGIEPQVFHMNEGHCAVLALERIRQLVRKQKMTFAEAREVVAASNVFTTHTPVPAGTDIFPVELVERYLAGWRSQVGLSAEQLMDLGRLHQGQAGEAFNMTALAIRTSCLINGVSRLHAKVSRNMWSKAWPEVPIHEVPIIHITNGIHPHSWISDDMADLYDRYLGPGWAEEPGDKGSWARAAEIPGEELWRTHERRRERLVAFARRRLGAQLRRRGAGKASITDAENVLDPQALTIGFARRFATYKRATLLLHDPERLARILNTPDRPVQVIYSGKAHPRDDEGKKLIRQIIHLSGRPEFRRRIVFLEDYDQVISRYLVEGVDVWLNNPRRPLEASGTSGMKAAFNGALNLSILDGWWDEAYSPRAGWAIGRGEEYSDLVYQDRVEASLLYDLLEREIVPLFYERTRDGLPRQWIEMMKTAMYDLCPQFNANRMLQEYVTESYHTARARCARLAADGYRRARELARWRQRVRDAWHEVEISNVQIDLPEEVRVGDEFEVRAHVRLGALEPRDVAAQIYLGRLDEKEEIVAGEIVPMEHAETSGKESLFRARVCSRLSGRQGLTVRLIPHHEDLAHPHCANRLLWAR